MSSTDRKEISLSPSTNLLLSDYRNQFPCKMHNNLQPQQQIVGKSIEDNNDKDLSKNIEAILEVGLERSTSLKKKNSTTNLCNKC